MNEISMIWITAAVGLGSSLITLICTKIIDICQEEKKFKRELFKLIFERKTSVVENAMSWYQEALDNYRMLQMSCTAYQEGRENYALDRLYISGQQFYALFKDSSSRLNPIYLYYDFSKIEQKYKSMELMERINERMNRIVPLLTKIQTTEPNSQVLKDLKIELKELLLSLSDNINSQINIILEIQNVLRNDYNMSV